MQQLFDKHMINLAEFDCFSQVTFKSIDDYKRMREDPWYKKQIAGDHVNFADTRRSSMTIGWVTDFIEHGALVDGSATARDLGETATTKLQVAALILGSFLSGMFISLKVKIPLQSYFCALGSMISLSAIAIPVLLETTTNSPQLFYQWTRIYRYGHQVLPGMAIGTFLLYSFECFQRRRAQKPKPWRLLALAALVTISIIPFTLLIMKPTNDELFRLESVTRMVQPGEQLVVKVMAINQAKGLVVKWAFMHAIRSTFPFIGAVIGAVAALWY